MRETFQKELETLINKHSQENGSNTPDYILAQYMKDCLDAFNSATKERARWYGENIPCGQPIEIEPKSK